LGGAFWLSHEHPLAALLLPPSRGEQVGAAALQLAGQATAAELSGVEPFPTALAVEALQRVADRIAGA
jgi:hypothetical protein